MKKFKIYVDYTLEETPRPFYVGKGVLERVKSLTRNNLHSRISKKYGIERKVIFETDNEQEAFEIEKKLILEYKTFIHGDANSWGANLTQGGEGTSGMIMSDEAKRKNSESNKISCSKEKNGMYGKHHSEETRKKIGIRSRGRHKSVETRQKMSTSLRQRNLTTKRKQISEATRQKISEARKGKSPWNKGLKTGTHKGCKHTEESKQKMSEARKGRIPWNKGLKSKKIDVEIKQEDIAIPTNS